MKFCSAFYCYRQIGSIKNRFRWIRKKTNGPAIEELNYEEDIDIFKQGEDVVIIYFGNDEKDIEEFKKVARKDDNIPFGIIKNEELIKKYAKNPKKIIMYKTFDEMEQELNIIKESGRMQPMNFT